MLLGHDLMLPATESSFDDYRPLSHVLMLLSLTPTSFEGVRRAEQHVEPLSYVFCCRPSVHHIQHSMEYAMEHVMDHAHARLGLRRHCRNRISGNEQCFPQRLVIFQVVDRETHEGSRIPLRILPLLLQYLSECILIEILWLIIL